MNTEENDPLWRLLGEAKPPTVSAFFSRNVLREIRESRAAQERTSGFFNWLMARGHLAGIALAAVVIMAGVGVQVLEKPGAKTVAEAPKQEILVAQKLAKNPDSDVIKNLDELLASDDNPVWLDNSAQ